LWLGLTLELVVTGEARIHQSLHQPVHCLAYYRRSRLSRGPQPRCNIHGVAKNCDPGARATLNLADHRHASVNADPQLWLFPVSSVEIAADGFQPFKYRQGGSTAHNGASSGATGAPNTAMTPSPVKPCTTPPCSRTAYSISFARVCMRVNAASSPACSKKVVKPTIFVNKTVSCTALRFHTISPAQP
jgi:hypothetical protein